MNHSIPETSGGPLLECEIGILTQPDGSASLLQGETSVLTAIYGPTQVRIAKELIDRATIDILFKPKSGLPTCADKYVQLLIRRCCESAIVTTLHPRTAINVIIQEVQDCGGFLSTAVNSTFLALLDSAVPLQFMVCAVDCVIDEDDKIIVNPNKSEEQAARASFVFAFDSKNKHMVACQTEGSFSRADLTRCLTVCRENTDRVFSFYRELMEKKIQKAILA